MARPASRYFGQVIKKFTQAKKLENIAVDQNLKLKLRSELLLNAGVRPQQAAKLESIKAEPVKNIIVQPEPVRVYAEGESKFELKDILYKFRYPFALVPSFLLLMFVAIQAFKVPTEIKTNVIAPMPASDQQQSQIMASQTQSPDNQALQQGATGLGSEQTQNGLYQPIGNDINGAQQEFFQNNSTEPTIHTFAGYDYLPTSIKNKLNGYSQNVSNTSATPSTPANINSAPSYMPTINVPQQNVNYGVPSMPAQNYVQSPNYVQQPARDGAVNYPSNSSNTFTPASNYNVQSGNNAQQDNAPQQNNYVNSQPNISSSNVSAPANSSASPFLPLISTFANLVFQPSANTVQNNQQVNNSQNVNAPASAQIMAPPAPVNMPMINSTINTAAPQQTSAPVYNMAKVLGPVNMQNLQMNVMPSTNFYRVNGAQTNAVVATDKPVIYYAANLTDSDKSQLENAIMASVTDFADLGSVSVLQQNDGSVLLQLSYKDGGTQSLTFVRRANGWQKAAVLNRDMNLMPLSTGVNYLKSGLLNTVTTPVNNAQNYVNGY